MMKISPSIQALIPAGVLAALVLFVFSTLQNYGPESAVRRFHEGIIRQDAEEITEVTLSPEEDKNQKLEEIQFIEGQIYSKLSQGYRIRLQDLKRNPKEVYVTVLYYAPGGGPSGNAPYAAVKTPFGWKVDVHKTLVTWNSFSSPRRVD